MTVRQGFIGANTIARKHVLNAVWGHGEGEASATGGDGARSPATAPAFVESARCARAISVDPGPPAP